MSIRMRSSVGRGAPAMLSSGLTVTRSEWIASLLFVSVCIVFGGGPGQPGISFLIIASSGFFALIAGLRGVGLRAFQSLPLLIRLAIASAVALPFLQIIPLPPVLWHHLPGPNLRLDVLDEYGLANAWLPISVSPVETAYSAVIGLAMFGLFIIALAMSNKGQISLIMTIVCLMCLGVIIGLFQVVNGSEFFYFYKTVHRGALIGFFANKNHMGLVLAATVPVSLILVEDRLNERSPWRFILISAWLLLLILLVATNSRAALLLGLLAMGLACFRAFRKHFVWVAIATLLLGVVITLLAQYVPAISKVLVRFGQSSQDIRIDILDQGMPLVRQYGFFGSGIGTWADVYPPTEKLQWVNPFIVNHLHNDWLQLLIEAGIPGAAVLLLLISAFGVAVRSASIFVVVDGQAARSGPPSRRQLAWAGAVITILFALHSIVDYPIRRVGALVVLIVAGAWLFRPLVKNAQRTLQVRHSEVDPP